MSLVPYGTKYATLTIPQARAVSAAYSAGRFAYTHRQGISKGARMVYRGVKRRYRAVSRMRRRKRARIIKAGDKVGSSSTKKAFAFNNAIILPRNTRTLYFHNATDISKQTTADEIDRRSRDIANVRGLKFCWQMMSTSGSTLTCNWALVVPKTAAEPATTGFFRGYGTTREVNFSTSLSSNEIHCLPINTDRYTVLTHKRFILGPANLNTTTTTPIGSWKNVKQFHKYVKVSRQFRFDGTAIIPENNPIFVCYWFDEWLKSGSTPVATSVVSLLTTDVIYFREPK